MPMKRFDICIIEDDQAAALELEHDIKNCFAQVGAIRLFDALPDAVESIKTKAPAIVMLDINLGKRNGFELFNYFPQPPFQTIMVTAYESFAIQAIRHQIADYLLKPVNNQQLKQALQVAVARLSKNYDEGPDTYPNRVAIPSQDRITLVDTDAIIYCTAQSNYCWIYLRNGEKLCASVTLGTISQKLDPAAFIRVHQSFLVARKSIYRFYHTDGGKLELDTGDKVPVSRSYKPALLQYLRGFLIR